MKYVKLIILFFVLISIYSCKEKFEIPITFVFDKPIENSNRYPGYFKDITEPFAAKCDVDILLKPINISRIDISNKELETTAWYFENAGDNTVEFSKMWLEQYFKDSTINSYLIQPSSKAVNLDSWFLTTKDSLLIYSEDSDLNEYYGKTVYTTTKELRSKLEDFSCINPTTKIVIYILKSDQTSTNSSNNISKGDLSINNIFAQLTDLNISPDNRIELIPSFLTQAFANNATIEEFGENGTRIGVLAAEEYFNQIVLSRTIKNIEVLESKKDGEGKYWTIKIVEHHDVHN